MSGPMKRTYLGEAAPPATKQCDWCGEPGVKAIEIKRPDKKIGSGQFLYPCSKHVATAQRIAEETATTKKRAA